MPTHTVSWSSSSSVGDCVRILLYKNGVLNRTKSVYTDQRDGTFSIF
ncbi:MAG TPA: hypothetical protein VLA96_13055 [Terriglobales bacterium]|nr:hypothetical protein [Terriglobales bacterium]